MEKGPGGKRLDTFDLPHLRFQPHPPWLKSSFSNETQNLKVPQVSVDLHHLSELASRTRSAVVQCMAATQEPRSCTRGAVYRITSGQGWDLYSNRSQLAASGQPHGMKEGNGNKWVCATERDLANDFYNENYMNNPFGNLIDYRVYLSMWVLKNRQYFLKIKNDLQNVF